MVLLTKHHNVVAFDIVIVEVEIDIFCENNPFNLTATLDKDLAYTDVDYVIIAIPLVYDVKKTIRILFQLKL